MADQSFESIVGEWYDRLYRFALSLKRTRDDALDLTQQTFFRWAEKGRQLRDRRRPKSWLFTVLYREFVNGWRIGRAPYRDQFELVEPLQPVPADHAKPFDSTRTSRRYPRESKGAGHDLTTSASSCCDGGNGTCC